MAPFRHVLLALFLGSAPLAAAHSAASQLTAPPVFAVIVHRSNPIDGVTFSELRRMFMLDTQTWPHGRKITVVLREKGQRERSEAIRVICGLSEAAYEKYVLLRVFQGHVSIGPRSILSSSGMLRFVSSAPGAIGYVAADEVDASVKVLRIDNLLPGDPQYRVRRSEPTLEVAW